MYRNAGYSLKVVAIAACSLCLLGSQRAFGQVLQGAAAFGSWRDDKPGVRRLIRPQDLPPISKAADGPAQVVPMPAGARPQLPPGFTAELVTSELRLTRAIRVAPNGDLFVVSTMTNSIRVLRVPAGSAKPEKITVFASGLSEPHGVAFYPLGPNPQWVYVANSDGVIRFPYKNGDLTASGKPQRIVEGILPTHHFARDLVLSPDGRRLFYCRLRVEHRAGHVPGPGSDQVSGTAPHQRSGGLGEEQAAWCCLGHRRVARKRLVVRP